MGRVRYAFIKAQGSVLRPIERPCERGGYELDIGSGGPTGSLPDLPFEGPGGTVTVKLARDLAPAALLAAQKLRREGQSVYRVHVGETWDPFLGPKEAHNLVLEAVEELARAQIDVEITTRAALPRDTVLRLAECAQHVTVVVPFVSMRPDIAEIWEPGAATPGERLRTVRTLTARGVPVVARVEPLVPLLNDIQGPVEEFCVAFAGVGVHRVRVSYLRLTPARARALARALPPMQRDMLKGCFANRPWRRSPEGGSYKTLDASLRRRGLERFVEEGHRRGIVVSVCGCTDGDVMGGTCHNVPVQNGRSGAGAAGSAPSEEQLEFFARASLRS